MVFQNYALYPHMTVRNNMAFSLALAKQGKSVIDQKVQRAAEILGLTLSLGHRRGGDQQVIAGSPKAVAMRESACDEESGHRRRTCSAERSADGLRGSLVWVDEAGVQIVVEDPGHAGGGAPEHQREEALAREDADGGPAEVGDQPPQGPSAIAEGPLGSGLVVLSGPA